MVNGMNSSFSVYLYNHYYYYFKTLPLLIAITILVKIILINDDDHDDGNDYCCYYYYYFINSFGWLSWAMVLGSFQDRGVLLLLHIVGQGPAVLAAVAGRLNMTEILWFRLLNPNGSCQLLPRTSSLSTV